MSVLFPQVLLLCLDVGVQCFQLSILPAATPYSGQAHTLARRSLRPAVVPLLQVLQVIMAGGNRQIFRTSGRVK